MAGPIEFLTGSHLKKAHAKTCPPDRILKGGGREGAKGVLNRQFVAALFTPTCPDMSGRLLSGRFE